VSGLAGQTAPPRRVSGLACVLGGRTHTNLVGAHLCVRPWTEVACCNGPTHRSAPTGVAKAFCILVGLRVLIVCSGRGMPRPYKNERSVTWRSDLFILLLYRIQICVFRVRARRPGAGRGYGVQRIRGTGAGSPDPLALAERAENNASCSKEINWMITQGDHAAAAATPHPALRATFPSKGKAKRGALTPHPIRRPQVLPLQGGCCQALIRMIPPKKSRRTQATAPFFNHFPHFAFQRSRRCGQICLQPMGNSQHTSRASSTPTEVSIMRLMAYAT